MIVVLLHMAYVSLSKILLPKWDSMDYLLN